MATNNEIAAFEDFKFQIGELLRLRAANSPRQYAVTASFNSLSSEWETMPVLKNVDTFIQVVVVGRSLVQGHSGGIVHCYYVRSAAFENPMIFEAELERIPAE